MCGSKIHHNGREDAECSDMHVVSRYIQTLSLKKERVNELITFDAEARILTRERDGRVPTAGNT